MNEVVPCAGLVRRIAPFYPKATSAGGRPAVGAERMLRMHLLQIWLNLSDPAVKEALYDSMCMRAFVGIDLGREPVTNETTAMRFGHLPEKNDPGKNANRLFVTAAMANIFMDRTTLAGASPSVARKSGEMQHKNRQIPHQGGIPLVVEGSDGGRFTDYATFVS